MKKYIMATLTVIFGFILIAQNSAYQHFQGNLGENMFVKANLQNINGKIFGTYYYVIKSGDEIINESSLIRLEGTKTLQNYTFIESDNKESHFEGVFTPTTETLVGDWSTSGREIPFHWKETYSKSSVPLKTLHLERTFPLIKKKEIPKATFDATLFYPEVSKGRLYSSYLDFVKEIFESNSKEDDLFTLLAIYKDDFFDRYYKNNIGKYDGEDSKGLNWSQKLKNDIYFNNENILSIYFTKTINTGGSVDLEMVYTANFDLKTGTRIDYERLFTPNYQEILKQELATQLREDFMIEGDLSFKDVGFFVDDIPLASNYLLTNNGILFFYNVYELAGNSFGKIEVFITYKKLQNILRDKSPTNN